MVTRLYLLTLALCGNLACAAVPSVPTIPVVPSAQQVSPPQIKQTSSSQLAGEEVSSIEIAEWCRNLEAEIKKLGWTLPPCGGVMWKAEKRSVLGRPLVYAEFGDPSAGNSTLIFTMVHSDEVTPLYLGLELAQMLTRQAALHGAVKGSHVVVAPLVNPDGFFRRTRTRTNANKVDLNRNLATGDWERDAVRLWKAKFSSNQRRFPGHRPASEPETVFQQELILRFKPQKILSIHAPLNFMDYDGPANLKLARFPKEYVQECLKLRARLKAVSGGFFPGSLGNFGGQELGIPTVTLELPTANPKNAKKYWQQFFNGITTMIDFVVPVQSTFRHPAVLPAALTAEKSAEN